MLSTSMQAVRRAAGQRRFFSAGVPAPIASTLPSVLSPVLTPFTNKGRVDLSKFTRQCHWLQENGVGLAVFGTNSEAASISTLQKVHALKHLVANRVNADQMMPGTGACAIAEAVTMTRAAIELKCAGVLMLPPFYYKDVPEDGLFQYYSDVINRVNNPGRLKIYVYNFPQMTGVKLPLTLLERLVERFPKNVVGMKDSSGDWAYTESCIKALAPKGFRVYAGSETFLLKTLRAGGVGCISATANVNPKAISDVAQNWTAADADEKQAALDLVRGTFAKYHMIGAMKAAVAHYSGDPTWDRLLPPLRRLDVSKRNALLADLKAINFTMPGLVPEAP